MKTHEELTALRDEVESLSKKLRELSEEDLAQVTGGLVPRDVSSRAAKERCDKLTGDFAADPGLHRTLLGDDLKAYQNIVTGVQIADGNIPPAPRGIPQMEVTFDIDTD